MSRKLNIRMQYRIKLDKSRHATNGEGWERCDLPYPKILKNSCVELSGVKTRKQKRVSDIFYSQMFIILTFIF